LMLKTNIKKLAILAADVGSRENFGWAGQWGSETDSGSSIKGLAGKLVDLVQDDWCVCLGFECPLFIPCPPHETALGKQREGEKGKPWSAGAGANSGILGVQQLCWVLDELKSNIRHDVQATLNLDEFKTGSYSLYIWEAFVSGAGKSKTHVGDARTALETFMNALPDPGTGVTCSRPISFAGLALLWSGLSNDTNLIHQPALVLTATSRPS